jgi:hypothetical protein
MLQLVKYKQKKKKIITSTSTRIDIEETAETRNRTSFRYANSIIIIL